MNPEQIISKEIDNQVGLYDEGDKHTHPAIVNDITLNGCQRRFYCGFAKKHKLEHEEISNKHYNFEDVKKFSRLEWRQIAEETIDELKLNEYNFEMSTLDYNGFTLEEVDE